MLSTDSANTKSQYPCCRGSSPELGSFPSALPEQAFQESTQTVHSCMGHKRLARHRVGAVEVTEQQGWVGAVEMGLQELAWAVELGLKGEQGQICFHA